MEAQKEQLSSPIYEVLTSGEVVRYYHVTRQAIAEACAKGWIPARQSGTVWLMARRDVAERWTRRE